jgi:choline dehydrogenase-like flavoprotein
LDATTGKVKVRSIKNRRVWRKLFEIMGRMLGSMGALRALPLVPFLKISHGGMGAHIGASFPMKKNPGPLETDMLGRLPRYKAVHIVDASVFSDIPPSTVTMTTMANAFRIAYESVG